VGDPTYVYRPFVDDLLTEAWERCGNSPTILNGDVARSARRSLQYTMLDFSARSLTLWTVEKVQVATVPGIATVTLDPSTVDVLNIYVTARLDGNELMLAPVPREAYLGMPRKQTTGQPNIYWPERVLPPVVHLFPTPDNIYKLAIWRIRVPADIASLSDSPDAPALWSEALAASLASRLATKFVDDPQKRAELKAEAEAAYRVAITEDRERTPFTILPDFGYSR
jgi:hypothetical protein